MKRYTIALALVAIFSFAGIGHAVAAPGPAPAGGALAEYDHLTGVITVSVNNVASWVVVSVGDMTGAEPVGLTQQLITNNDNSIGEASFIANFSYTDLNLGPVAVSQIQGPNVDFFIEWSQGEGFEKQSGLVDVVNVPEPATLALAGFGICGVIALRRRRVA